MSTHLDDKVRMLVNDGIRHTEMDIPFPDFYDLINNRPEGMKRIRKDVTVSLVDAGALYVNALTLPAGAIVRYAGMIIRALVVAGGTSVKVGLGPNASDTDKYGITADLVLGTQKVALYNDSTPLATSEGVDVIAVTSAGTAKGNTNFSAGSVRVVMVYDVPNVLE